MRRSDFRSHKPKKPVPAKLGLSGKDLSRQQEKRVARRTGGREMPASGALPYAKGDTLDFLSLLECKTTGKGSLRVERKWLAKITREARQRHKEPGVVVSFPGMASDVDQDWIMVPLALFNRLVVDARDENT